MTQKAGIVSTLINIIVAPKQAIVDIEGNNKWMWVPLILLLGASASLIAYYYQIIDLEWMIDQISAAAEEPLPPEARAFMTRTTMITGGMISIFVMIPIIFAIYALCLHLVDKISGNGGTTYSSWFSLTVWSSFPGIIAPLASFIILLTATSTQISMDEMNFLTANALITHYPVSHPAAAFMGSITPFTFWTLALAGMGIAHKTGRSFGKSTFIAAIPYIVIYGIWGFTVLG